MVCVIIVFLMSQAHTDTLYDSVSLGKALISFACLAVMCVMCWIKLG